MYIIGLLIVAISMGYRYDQITGWMVLGAGFIFAAIWNSVADTIAAKSKNVSD
jgi:hypothetical protein